MVKLPPCGFTTVPHHSRDRIEVYHGTTVPVILCGYHASPAWIKRALEVATGTRAEEGN